MKKTLQLFAFLIPIIAISQTGFRTVNFNGLKATIYSDGTIEETQFAGLPGKNLIYSNHLWLAGQDLSGQLFISAQTYSSTGIEFQSGPISSNVNIGQRFGHVWLVTSGQIDSMKQGLYSTIPLDILTWPAHGDTSYGEARYLAPFTDVDGNGIYEPENGDFPCIKGDVCALVIFNDDLSTIGIGPGLKAEVQLMVYGYNSFNNLHNALFTDYKITNRSALTYSNFIVSNWADFDLGNSLDDLMGTNVNTQSIFAYNADTLDEGVNGFGPNPPAVGISQLKGFDADLGDGRDNDWDGCVDGVRDANGNCIPESATNREQVLLTSSANYFNVFSPSTGNPFSGVDHYQYMRGRWMDGNHIILESPCGFDCISNGDGYVALDTGLTSSFVFPGNSYDTYGNNFPVAPTNWFSNPTYGSLDTRMLASSGEITFAPNQELTLSYVQVATNAIGTSDRNYTELQAHIQGIRDIDTLKENCLFSSIGIEEENLSIFKIYPNPAHEVVTINNETTEAKTLTLSNALGQELLTLEISSFSEALVDVSALKSGLYILTDEKGKSQKLVVQ